MKRTHFTRLALLIVVALCLATLLMACQTTATVTFEINGIVKQEFAIGDTITTPSSLEVSGTTIIWYTDKGLTSKWNNDTPLKGDLHLYGKRETVEITIAQAKALCTETESTQRYRIRATVKSIDNASYGQMTITDETGDLSVYGTRGADGKTYYQDMKDKPYAGDEVLLSATLQLFNGKPEVKMGWILEVKHNEVKVDETAYTQMTIAQARNAAKDTLVKTSGVVSRIIYANGMIPCGFILIDNTSSMYVYDGQIAARVAIGNTITILGTKDYYILDSEKTNAEKFGYKGCNQLKQVILKENDEKTTDFNKEWITETSVKDIMDTPVSQDISVLTYKVNALIKKAEGTGFTNYYIDDIDGKTGSYTYTMCNGNDFAWLDEFDGKICTVYLTAFNAKASNAGCVWRFIPVEVKYENYEFDVKDAPDYAIKFEAADQFKNVYAITEETTLPNELVTSVSSELLKFENVAITYESSNNDILAITIENGKPYLTLKGFGKATLTITATHGDNTATKTIEIRVNENVEADSITVAEAISAKIGDEVVVKGIVGPSLVNQTGFYLIDESGVIAVITDNDNLAEVQLGNEVIVRGTRATRKKDAASEAYFGQSNLDNSKVLSNDYGKHDYSTATFITDKTLSDLQAIPVTDDATTTVYVLKAKVKVVDAQYYSNIYLTFDGAEHDFTLYCSSANQYSWLKAYNGQEVTVEIALCNWNSKNYYTGCVLALIKEDGTKICNELNFSK